MSETTKKSRYTKAQKKSAEKYLENFEIVSFRVPKGKRELFRTYASSLNLSLTQLINKLITEDMLKHNYNPLSEEGGESNE